VKELGVLIDRPHQNRLAYEAIDLLSRREARPILPAARRYFADYSFHWPTPLPDSCRGENLYHCRWTLDFKPLAQARDQLPPREHPAHIRDRERFLYTASRVCGRQFTTLDDFDNWWDRTLVRSKKTSGAESPKVEERVREFLSADQATRDAGFKSLLDLGLPILPFIERLKKDSDNSVRTIAASLEDELLLIKDFRDDLAR
jgi:hypothetical protein